MNIAIFGLAISSSWGNGHAALWRGLVKALLRAGHGVTFFERDVPWYASHRDLSDLPHGGKLIFYRDWAELLGSARALLAEINAAVVTSYCPDGRAAARLVLDSNVSVRCFYDLDTPITLARLEAGENVEYLLPEGLRGFDLVLSYTGGKALELLCTWLGAKIAIPLYGSVDPELHVRAAPRPQYASCLSYIGTYAANRQFALEQFLVAPARLRPDARFVIAGAQYPCEFPWEPNIFFVRHLPPAEHGTFYSSSRLTLNVTRAAMARLGWCPSGRLFEAAACGTPILTDWWEGLESFFQPGSEILVARTTEDVLAALDLPDLTLQAIARRARDRVFANHTSTRRGGELIAALESVMQPELMPEA